MDRPDREPWHVSGLVVTRLREIQPVGEAWVDEELVRMQRHEDVRGVEIHPDVTASAALRPKCDAELLRVVERLAEHQPAPAEILDDTRRGTGLQIGPSLGRHHGTTPSTWRASHSSSNPSCHNGFPRSGVRFPFGSASSPSTALSVKRPRSRADALCSASRTSSRYGPARCLSAGTGK